MQQLKSKFGKGYLLETKAPEDRTDEVVQFIKQQYSPDPDPPACRPPACMRASMHPCMHAHRYPGADLVDQYGEMRNFAIPQGGLKLSEAFSLLEENKARLGIIDYSLSQASLEQVSEQHTFRTPHPTHSAMAKAHMQACT